MTSSKMAAKIAAILNFSKNPFFGGKSGNCKYCFAKAVKYDTIKHFADISCVL